MSNKNGCQIPLVRSETTTLNPLLSSDRCYPQHLIQVVIELLAAAPIDWAEIRTTEDLRKQLNL